MDFLGKDARSVAYNCRGDLLSSDSFFALAEMGFLLDADRLDEASLTDCCLRGESTISWLGLFLAR